LSRYTAHRPTPIRIHQKFRDRDRAAQRQRRVRASQQRTAAFGAFAVRDVA